MSDVYRSRATAETRRGRKGSARGQPETWLAPGTVIDTDRTITAIQGDAVTVDVPLSDSLDAKYVTPPGPRAGAGPLDR